MVTNRPANIVASDPLIAHNAPVNCSGKCDHEHGHMFVNLSSIYWRHRTYRGSATIIQTIGRSTTKHYCKPLLGPFRPQLIVIQASARSHTTHDKLAAWIRHHLVRTVVSAPAALLHCMLTSRCPVSMSVPASIGSARLLSTLSRARCLQVVNLPSHARFRNDPASGLPMLRNCSAPLLARGFGPEHIRTSSCVV